jgi:AcrR family transcriptional regulator
MLVTNIISMATPKSVATRQRLLESALTLFETHGYDATTVDDIAAHAGVSPMTFFRYFRAKEAVVLDDSFDPVIAQSVALQPADLAPMARIARGLRHALAHLDEQDDAEVRRRIAIAAPHPALRSGMHQNTRITEDAIVTALAHDNVPEFAARVAASACLGAITASLLMWGPGATSGTLREAVLAGLDVVAPDPAAGGASTGGAA